MTIVSYPLFYLAGFFFMYAADRLFGDPNRVCIHLERFILCVFWPMAIPYFGLVLFEWVSEQPGRILRK